MAARSQSPQAREAFDNAEARVSRKMYGGLTFSSVERALDWYFPTREKMQSPQRMHPRGEDNGRGEVVFLSVDGGQGGDLDEVLVTSSTIGSSLEALRQQNPKGYQYLEWSLLGDIQRPDIDSAIVRRANDAIREGAAKSDKQRLGIIDHVAERHGVESATLRDWMRRSELREPAGMTYREMSGRTGESISTVSAELGRATTFLAGWLVHAGVVR
jgi:hypothetical protein